MNKILYCPQCRTRLTSVRDLPWCEICECDLPEDDFLTPLSISTEKIYQDVEAMYTDTRFSELNDSLDECCFHTERQIDSDVCYIREDLVKNNAESIKSLLNEFDKFAEETKNLPVQQEDEHKGQCAYNWHIDIVRRFEPFVEQAKEVIKNKSPWQPTETAPTDGKPFLAKYPIVVNNDMRFFITVCVFDQESGCYKRCFGYVGFFKSSDVFVSWMPIPE